MGRHAKASSAGSTSGTGSSRVRFGRALACLLGFLACVGSGAPAALAAEPPLTTTEAASAVGDTTATLNGKVNPQGAEVANCQFEYGTTASYGAVIACFPSSLGSGKVNVGVSAQLEALEPGTTYHYRLVASSANGASQGVDRTFVTGGAPICPNADRRLEQGIVAIQLPDCMALEQVSPPKKLSQRALEPVISADGSRVLYRSLASLAGTTGSLSPTLGDPYVASRNGRGWKTSAVSPPPHITRGWNTSTNLARSFDPTLSRWVVMGSRVEDSQFLFGIGQLFRDSLDGPFEPASPLLIPSDGGVHGEGNVKESYLQAASADHSRLFFAMGEASTTYLPGDPSPTAGFDRNVYLAHRDLGGQPSIELLGRDAVGADAGKAWGGNCGARVGGLGHIPVVSRTQGAVSPDGTRAYLSTRAAQPPAVACDGVANKLRILNRTETPSGPDIVHLLPSEGAGECTRVAPPCKTEAELNGDDYFQGASVDGSKVYLTTSRQLADSDLDGTSTGCNNSAGVAGCDLYLYDIDRPAGQRLIQVSAGEVNPRHPVVGDGASVLNGTVAISGDGSHVYFAAAGVLTTDPSPAGRNASEYLAGDPKLYGWDAVSEAVEFIGPLSPDDASLWGSFGTFQNAAYPVPATGEDGNGNEVGGDGGTLLFQTRAPITANDADGGKLDAFRYDAKAGPATLQCVSCRPGGPDAEPFDVVRRTAKATGRQAVLAGTAFAEADRWVSEDGETVALSTAQRLLPADTNEFIDEYLWREGKLSLLPGATQLPGMLAIGEEAPLAMLSHDGEEVGFTSYLPLLSSDTDAVADVYVARVGGGFPGPVDLSLCAGEACQASGSTGPAAPSTATATFSGRGNASDPRAASCPKGKRKVFRNGKPRCVKSKKGKGKGASKKRANRNRGGQK
jgi:hypothetical protein